MYAPGCRRRGEPDEHMMRWCTMRCTMRSYHERRRLTSRPGTGRISSSRALEHPVRTPERESRCGDRGESERPPRCGSQVWRGGQCPGTERVTSYTRVSRRLYVVLDMYKTPKVGVHAIWNACVEPTRRSTVAGRRSAVCVRCERRNYKPKLFVIV